MDLSRVLKNFIIENKLKASCWIYLKSPWSIYFKISVTKCDMNVAKKIKP